MSKIVTDLLRVYYTLLDTPRVDADGLTLTQQSIKKCIMLSKSTTGRDWVNIPRTGKHESAGRKTSFHGKENINPR